MPWSHPTCRWRRYAGRDGPSDRPARIVAFVPALKQSFDVNTHSHNGIRWFIGPPSIAKSWGHFSHPFDMRVLAAYNLNASVGNLVADFFICLHFGDYPAVTSNIPFVNAATPAQQLLNNRPLVRRL